MFIRGVEGWIELGFPTRPSAAQVRALHWLEDDGLLSLERLEDGVRFPTSAWLAAGELPASSASAEETDEWQRRHDEVARLLEMREQTVHVDVTGFLGGSSCRLSLLVDGVKVPPEQSGPALLRSAMLPVVFKAHTDLQRAFETPGSEGRIAELGQLKTHLGEAAALLAGSNVPLHISFHPHLRDVQVRAVKRAALAWQPAAVGANLFSLQLEEVFEDESRRRLPLEKLSNKGPLISIAAKDYLLLPPEIAEAARVARKNSNTLERNIERDPTRLLPPGYSYESIDLSGYSDRVLGFEHLDGGDRMGAPATGVAWYARDSAAGIPMLTLNLQQRDGTACERLVSAKDIPALLAEARAAADRGRSIQINGESFAISPALVEQLERHSAGLAAEAPGTPAFEERQTPPARTRLEAAVIRENEGAGRRVAPVPVASVPWSALTSVLAPEIRLQEHQRHGVAWLWSHYQARRRGVLLADEMGLGKTLQIGCFLALQFLAGREEDRRRSSLIVCPKVLVSNWVDEMKRYFKPGSLPVTRELRNDWLRRGDADLLEALPPTYFVLSYEAFAKYQRELLRRHWASAVLDESQNIKNPDTYRTRAARGLQRSFGVCATGTPVENRLRDLWTQFDFLTPGVPFGAPKEFCPAYEQTADGATRLRAALSYPSASSPVLHREKRDVLSALPAPRVEVHLLAMTREQAAAEHRIVRSTKEPLKILSSLQKLYQHPALLGTNGTLAPDAAVTASPKLARCIDILHGVRAAGEKALIFTLWSQMQDLLADVLQHTFGERPNVVNGASNQSGQSKKILERFSSAPGFGVLVMSPLAAGAGLNVTAANHVIHYGRWWNPAKEDQATARAHRIGQARQVHVHYLVLHHPDDPSEGFDRKLHDYVANKRQVATDFLAPADDQHLEGFMASLRAKEGEP